VAIPTPNKGALIWFSYLWAKDYLAGQIHGRKTRRCIVLASSQSAPPYGPVRVVVCPITHTEPEDLSTAIEISLSDAVACGLDDCTSWVIVNDVNHFIWPGYDTEADWTTGVYEIGHLAPLLFDQITERFRELRKLGRLKAVSRDAAAPAVASAKPKIAL
jgi:hypothetical protein